jgi:hypothetical protein
MVSEYDGRQFVGIDLHRRRTVIVRQSETGEQLGSVRIVNDPLALAREVGEAGPAPEVVLEATYGWYWAADVLAEAGARVHLAHPLGIKGFAYRRVKNDVRDAADLADLLRMGRPTGGVAGAAGGAGAARAGPAPGQAGAGPVWIQGRGARSTGQAGPAPAGQGSVRAARARRARRSAAGSGLPGPGECLPAPGRRPRRRDRVGRRVDRRPAHRPRGVSGDPGHPRGRPSVGGGVRGRDR